MRVWVSLAIYLLATAAAARAGDAQAMARQQTFVVQSCTGAQQAEIGGGVVVARNGDVLTLATAAHLILPKATLRILDVTRRAYYDVLDVRTFPEYDLAFIRVRAQTDFPISPVEIAQAKPGESVWLWGHPADGFWRLASGSVKQTDAHIAGLSGASRITIDCETCAHGDSGSGVFDEQGRLLGILTRAWRTAGAPVLFLEVEPASIISQEIQVESATATRNP